VAGRASPVSMSLPRGGKGPRKISRHFCKQLVKDVIEDLEDGGGFNVESLKNDMVWSSQEIFKSVMQALYRPKLLVGCFA
jgi:hypothetical protein